MTVIQKKPTYQIWKRHLAEYFTWQNMKKRCYYKKHNSFERYGAKGITVCERWKNSFPNFLYDMGTRPEGMSIDRIDNNKGYSPDNCKWSTIQEQNLNRSSIKMISYNGITLCIADWAKKVGMSQSGLLYRFVSGWSTEEALTSPANNSIQNHMGEGGKRSNR